jgi:hypothetical protein
MALARIDSSAPRADPGDRREAPPVRGAFENANGPSPRPSRPSRGTMSLCSSCTRCRRGVGGLRGGRDRIRGNPAGPGRLHPAHARVAGEIRVCVSGGLLAPVHDGRPVTGSLSGELIYGGYGVTPGRPRLEARPVRRQPPHLVSGPGRSLGLGSPSGTGSNVPLSRLARQPGSNPGLAEGCGRRVRNHDTFRWSLANGVA